MRADRTPRGGRRFPERVYVWFLLAAPVLLLALLRLPTLFEPMWYGDEAIFGGIAQDVRAGQTLYADAWDNKPPLIFLTYAGIQATTNTSIFALHLVTSLWVIAAQIVIIAIAWRLYGGLRAAVGGFVFALLLGSPIIEGNLALTEAYMILPASLAVLTCVLAYERPEPDRLPWYLAAGVLLGIAANYKQVAIFDAAAIGGMVLLIERRPLPAVAALGAGFVAPHLVAIAWFAAQGAINDYFYAVVEALGAYRDLADAPSPGQRVGGFAPLVAGIVWMLHWRRAQALGWRHFALVWFGFGFAGATVSSFSWPHYLLQATAPAALLAASIRTPSFDVKAPATAWAMWLPVVAVMSALWVVNVRFADVIRAHDRFEPGEYYARFFDRLTGDITQSEYEYRFDYRIRVVDEVQRAIDDDCCRGTTLFQWSEFAWLYVATGMTNPTPCFTSFMGSQVPDGKTGIMADLRDAPPAYVFIADDAYSEFPQLDRFVDERYEIVKRSDDWRLYGIRE